MPKIKIIGGGLEGTTGLVGSIEFKDGVSVENVSPRDAERLGSIFPIVDVDTEEEVNAAAAIEKRMRVAEKTRPKQADSEKSVEAEQGDADVQKDEQSDAQSDEARLYTEAELADIASKHGLAGLREIAKPLGVTSKSITDIIPKILKAQEADE